jgi:hypothetical protein
MGSTDQVPMPKNGEVAGHVVTLLASVCAAATAGAADIQVAAELGIGRTDNIGRATVDERSETIRSLGLQFSVLEQTRRVDTDLIGDLSWLDYASDAYSGELVGTAAGRLRLELIDNRLSWQIEDRFGQVRQDLFSAPNPDNRENINHFSTGPDLRLSLGRMTALLLGGRYTLVNYETTDADTKRLSAYLAASRELSSTARVSLNVSGEQVQPQGAGIDADYDRTAAFLRYEITGQRTSIGIDAGANQVKGSGIDGSGLLLRFDLTRRIGNRSQLQFRAGHEYTDSGASMGLEAGALPLPGSGTSTIAHSAAPYTDRYVQLGWSIEGRRTNINLSGRWSDQDYDDAGSPDVKRASMEIGATRRLGRRTEIRAQVRHELHDYPATGLDNDETIYNLRFAWDFGRRFGLTIAGEHSRFGAGNGPSADETRYWLRLRYGQWVSR